MIKKFVLLLSIIVMIPFSQGLPWMSMETHTLYSTSGWHRVIVDVENPRISAGHDSFAVWNSREVVVFEGENQYRFTISGIKKLWVGSGHVLISLGDGRNMFLSVENGKRTFINGTSIQDALLTPSGAVVLKPKLSLINVTTGEVKDLSNYTFLSYDFNHHNFILSRGDSLYILGRGWKNRSLDSPISSATAFQGGYYVISEGELYHLNFNLEIISKSTVNAGAVYTLGNNPITISKMVDDEGKKQWVLNLYNATGENLTLQRSYFTYLEPMDVRNIGKFLSFCDEKSIHIVSREYHLLTNNSFTNVVFTDEEVIGVNRTGVYEITVKRIESTIALVGDDYDMDWIPDSKDGDDDNDGMPDSWEIKYHLNPLNAADRSMDYDHDGLTNYQEYLNGTNPRNWDTDGDGLSDGYEVEYGMNPLVPNREINYNINLTTYLAITLLAALAIIGLKKEEGN